MSRRLDRLRAAIRTVQGRITLGATLLVLAALTCAAIGLDLLLGATALDAFDEALVARAEDRARLVALEADPEALAATLGEEEFVVIYDASGSVAAAQGLDDPAGYLAPTSGTVQTQDVTIRKIEYGGTEVEVDTETLRVAAAATADGGLVVVGSETEQIERSRSVERTALAIGVPLLVLAAGLLAWRIVGAALRPVEALRRDVDELAGTGGRVGVPDTGDEIHDLAVTMNELLERTDAHQAEQRRFIADASHELKSPVANLRVVVETSPALAAVPDEQAVLVGETERLQGLIDDLLFLARTEAGHGAARVSVALDDLVFDVVERVQPRESDLAIDVGGVEPTIVHGRAPALARVVANLVDNAVRHADRRIAVQVRAEDGRAVLAVGDDGAGIPVADRERVFERFTRLDDARTRGGGGSGLGLAIVRRIAEDHGGSVSIDRSSLGGAEVTVELPND